MRASAGVRLLARMLVLLGAYASLASPAGALLPASQVTAQARGEAEYSGTMRTVTQNSGGSPVIHTTDRTVTIICDDTCVLDGATIADALPLVGGQGGSYRINRPTTGGWPCGRRYDREITGTARFEADRLRVEAGSRTVRAQRGSHTCTSYGSRFTFEGTLVAGSLTGEDFPTPIGAGTEAATEPARGSEPAAPATTAPSQGGADDGADLAQGEDAAAVGEPLFARAVAAPSDASFDVPDLVRSLLLVILLMLLIVFPSHLFNSTVEGNYDEIRGWFRRKKMRPPVVVDEANEPAEAESDSSLKRPLKGWPAFLGFTVVSSVLYGFLDPAFGLNRGSAIQLSILVVSTIILTLVFAWPTRNYMKRSHGDEGFLQVLPGALVFALVCVVASRLADFQPGYFYGVIAGFAFTRSLNRQEAGRATAIAAAFMLVLALAAWGVQGVVPMDGASIGTSLLRAVLGGLFVGGVEGLVFGLLPLRFMSGEKLWAWSKALWVVLIGAPLFLFVHVLLDPESGYLADTGTTPLGTVIGFFAGFGIFSVAFWAFFRYRKETAAT